MSIVNTRDKTITTKIVYYGTGLGGKTTSLKVVHGILDPERKVRLISLKTDEERTLFFDFLPIDLGTVRGFKVRFHIYTVPGQVFYDASRKLVLKGADGIIFVADSQPGRIEANIESVENLAQNLADTGGSLEKLPYVMQYNKRDLPEVTSIEELRESLNPMKVPEFEASAIKGVGVFETLKALSKQVLQRLAKQEQI
jgi:signal recognition particle receptor subunit beta